MAVISIKDSTVEILSTNPNVKSGLGRYLPKAGAQFLATADFVTIHMPKTPETTGMIGKRELARH